MAWGRNLPSGTVVEFEDDGGVEEQRVETRRPEWMLVDGFDLVRQEFLFDPGLLLGSVDDAVQAPNDGRKLI